MYLLKALIYTIQEVVCHHTILNIHKKIAEAHMYYLQLQAEQISTKNASSPIHTPRK